MSTAAIERWKKKREGGKARYILQTGVFGWGLTMFVVMTFFINKRPENLKGVFVAALIWLVCGAGFGWLTWEVNERFYLKATANSGA